MLNKLKLAGNKVQTSAIIDVVLAALLVLSVALNCITLGKPLRAKQKKRAKVGSPTRKVAGSIYGSVERRRDDN